MAEKSDVLANTSASGWQLGPIADRWSGDTQRKGSLAGPSGIRNPWGQRRKRRELVPPHLQWAHSVGDGRAD